MTGGSTLDANSTRSILKWAVDKQAPISASLLADEGWCNLRSHFVRYDAARNMLQIIYPIATDHTPPPEMTVGEEIGIAFRRGHKKCVFVAPIVGRAADATPDGQPIDTLLLKVPDEIAELQRRAYQRVVVPPDRFIGAKVWQGGVPAGIEPNWPLCAGRVGNISAGGVLIDIRSEHNPRLSVGEIVGIEIGANEGGQPLLVEGQYRHCTMTEPGRLGLGFQFLGLEHNLPGRTAITDVAKFVRNVRQASARHFRHPHGGAQLH